MKESQRKGRDLYLVRQDWLETAAEVAEVVPVLMYLDSLPIILDLREHAIRTLLHRVLDGLAGLGLGVGKEKPGDLTGALPRGAAQQGQPRAQVPGTNSQSIPPGQAAEEVMGMEKAGQCRTPTIKAPPKLTQELAF